MNALWNSNLGFGSIMANWRIFSVLEYLCSQCIKNKDGLGLFFFLWAKILGFFSFTCNSILITPVAAEVAEDS